LHRTITGNSPVYIDNFYTFATKFPGMNKTILLLTFFLGIFSLSYSQTLQLPDTTGGCQNNPVILDAGADFQTYLWSTGDTTQQITVVTPGQYSITVTDTTANHNIQKDTTFVSFLQFSIIPHDTLLICPDSVVLSVEPSTLACVWSTGVTANSIKVKPKKTTKYFVTITDGLSFCTDTVEVKVQPPYQVFMEQFYKGCADTCDGQYRAKITGGTLPYHLLWDSHAALFDTVAVDLCPGSHQFSVTDGNGCRFDTVFTVDAYPASKVEIKTDTVDKVYLQNPTVKFSFTESGDSPVSDWLWNFGDSTTSQEHDPSHTYVAIKKYYKQDVKSYQVSLWVKNENGCDTTYVIELPIEEIKLTIPNVFTPNGDGTNELFVIKELEKYISTELVVFNRWGRKVYEKNNYDSKWGGDGLSDGVYFYILRCKGYFKDDVFKGSVTIIR